MQGPKTDLRIYFYITFTLDVFTIVILNLTITPWAELRLELLAHFIEKESEVRVTDSRKAGALGLTLDLEPLDLEYEALKIN